MIEMKISPTDDCTWFNEDYTLMIDGDTPKEAEVAAGKINNHDRMVEEIAGLKGKLLEHKEFNELMHSMPTDWTVKRSIELHKETEQLLAKLNQEGEE